MNSLLAKFNKKKVNLPTLPQQVWIEIFLYINDAQKLAEFRIVCKEWKNNIDVNEIWSIYAARRWPTVRPSSRIKNWQNFFTKRYAAEVSLKPLKAHPIENCYEFEFKCPLMMENLSPIKGKSNQLFCHQCKNVVKIVSTREELEWECAEGNCVSFTDYSPEIQTLPSEPINVLVVGDSGVGKTTFVRNLYKSTIDERCGSVNLSPVGEDNCYKLEFPTCKLHIFDCNVLLDELREVQTPGEPITYEEASLLVEQNNLSQGIIQDPTQVEILRMQINSNASQVCDRIQNLIHVDPKEISVILVCFSMADKNSFKVVNRWRNIRSICNASRAKVVLCGLKSDLMSQSKFTHPAIAWFSNNVSSEKIQESVRCNSNSWHSFIQYEDNAMTICDDLQRISAERKKGKRAGGCVAF